MKKTLTLTILLITLCTRPLYANDLSLDKFYKLPVVPDNGSIKMGESIKLNGKMSIKLNNRMCTLGPGYSIHVEVLRQDYAQVTNYSSRNEMGGCPYSFIIASRKLAQLKKNIRRQEARDEVFRSVLVKLLNNGIKKIGDLEVGQVHTASIHREVKKIGPLGVLETEPDCHIDIGDRLEVVGFSEDELNALVKLISSGGEKGSTCKIGYMFILPIQELKLYSHKYKKVQKATIEKIHQENLKREEIRRQMKLIQKGEGPNEVNGFRTGQKTIIKESYQFKVAGTDDYCTVYKEEYPGILEIEGFSSDKKWALIQYSHGGKIASGRGTCLKGLSFQVDVEKLPEIFNHNDKEVRR